MAPCKTDLMVSWATMYKGLKNEMKHGQFVFACAFLCRFKH